jgi:hypothetical protein
MPPSTTKPNFAAPAWRKLTNRMGSTMSNDGKIVIQPSFLPRHTGEVAPIL